jgi:hypothetical protein
MKRRTVLGIAAAALTGCSGEKPLVVKSKRVKIGHVPGGGNNYEWASKEYQYRAQMLALTVMLFNGTNEPGKPPKMRGYFIDFKNNSTQSGITAPDHPLNDVKKEIYEKTWTYCNSLGWDKANEQLWNAATTMQGFANAGLSFLKADEYTNPDECPCFYQPDYDCPPVDPLL